MNILLFAELEKTMAYFKPLSGPGKKAAENLSYLCEKERSLTVLKSVKTAFEFSRKKKISADKIKYHLKRIPLLPQTEIFGQTEIFLIKRFLNNSKAICASLTEKEKKVFSLSFDLQELLDKISADSSSDEFFISDDYSPALAEVRRKIKDLEQKEKKAKKEFYSKIYARYGLDFSGKDFLVIDSDSAVKSGDLIYFEPHDNFSFLAKPIFTQELTEIIFEKEKNLKKEKEIETEILQKLGEHIKENRHKIERLCDSIALTDLAFAGADMALTLGLKEPKLGNKRIECKEAFFPPLKNRLEADKIRYTPLTFKFDENINIIKGSNMGGKTVVLKTLALCQVLAQMGLFVPAREYKAPFFSSIFFLGDKEQSGLSSFGCEINDLIEVLKEKKEPYLIFSDEFAKTTDSFQACALLSSLIRFFSKEKAYFFAATHLSGLPKELPAAFLSMRGFDSSKYSADKNKSYLKISERLKEINKHMDYTLIKLSEEKRTQDALAVAQILGLDGKILEFAKEYLDSHNKKN
ncbi:MAG: hypothetical protein GX447_03120 [Elusimicrobia bacterium]|nr:hypothetical protein [Elusimicrobiota bacterium]